MRFSLIQSTPKNMYRYNPYINDIPAPAYTMEAFVAPANFDPDAQELNIVKAYAAFSDVNKKYVFSVGTTATTVLPAVTGRSYAYSENGGAYTPIVSGTVTWTVGSMKRHVIVVDTNTPVSALIPLSGVWVYCGDKCTSISSNSNSDLKYIHFETLNSLIAIDIQAFTDCTGLIGVLVIPNSVKYINVQSFRGCSGLTSLIIPNSVTGISYQAFYGCTGLTGALNIPNSVTSIGTATFYGCSGFTSLTLPNTLPTIVDSAFLGCSGLTGNLSIPNSVISVQIQALAYCSKLTSLIIPNSVTNIGFQTFYGCTGLIRIDSLRINPPAVEGMAFGAIDKTTCILHVPIGSLAAYRAAAYWSEFTNIIEDL